MLAKVIAYGPSRVEAARRLAKALGETRVHGVRTNVPLLLEILRHPEFLAGRLDTHFIAKHVVLDAALTPAQEEANSVHAVATALWLQERRGATAPVLRGIRSGWRNNPSQMQEVSFTSGETTVRVGYRVHARDNIDVNVDGRGQKAAVLSWDEAHIALVLDDVRRSCRIISQHELHYVHSSLGTSELREVPRFPPPAREEVRGGCLAPMPGKILAVRVEPGQSVKTGDTLVILEAMKMEHEVSAPHDGIVREVCVEVGQQVDAGVVLVVLDEQRLHEERSE